MGGAGKLTSRGGASAFARSLGSLTTSSPWGSAAAAEGLGGGASSGLGLGLGLGGSGSPLDDDGGDDLGDDLDLGDDGLDARLIDARDGKLGATLGADLGNLGRRKFGAETELGDEYRTVKTTRRRAFDFVDDDDEEDDDDNDDDDVDDDDDDEGEEEEEEEPRYQERTMAPVDDADAAWVNDTENRLAAEERAASARMQEHARQLQERGQLVRVLTKRYRTLLGGRVLLQPALVAAQKLSGIKARRKMSDKELANCVADAFVATAAATSAFGAAAASAAGHVKEADALIAAEAERPAKLWRALSRATDAVVAHCSRMLSICSASGAPMLDDARRSDDDLTSASYSDSALYAYQLDTLAQLGAAAGDDDLGTLLAKKGAKLARAKKRRTDARGDEVPRTSKGKRLRYHTMDKLVGFAAATGEPPSAELGHALLTALRARSAA